MVKVDNDVAEYWMYRFKTLEKLNGELRKLYDGEIAKNEALQENIDNLAQELKQKDVDDFFERCTDAREDKKQQAKEDAYFKQGNGDWR